MNILQLNQNITYLIYKYMPSREDLITLIHNDPDSVKYILSEIDKNKICMYSDNDLDLIKEIVYYYAWNLYRVVKTVLIMTVEYNNCIWWLIVAQCLC